jgi:hypothetical protein
MLHYVNIIRIQNHEIFFTIVKTIHVEHTHHSKNMEVLRVEFISRIRGFHHAEHPIYLCLASRPFLQVDYRVTDTAGRVINPEHLNFKCFFCFGDSEIPVPDSASKPALQNATHQHFYQHLAAVLPADSASSTAGTVSAESNFSTLSFRPQKGCLSAGGMHSTVRLRLVIAHALSEHASTIPVQLALAWCDSHRFAIMTRSLPTSSRLDMHLKEWDFEPAAEPSLKRQRPNLSTEPITLTLPDGGSLFSLHGLLFSQSIAQFLLACNIQRPGNSSTAPAASSSSLPAPSNAASQSAALSTATVPEVAADAGTRARPSRVKSKDSVVDIIAALPPEQKSKLAFQLSADMGLNPETVRFVLSSAGGSS